MKGRAPFSKSKIWRKINVLYCSPCGMTQVVKRRDRGEGYGRFKFESQCGPEKERKKKHLVGITEFSGLYAVETYKIKLDVVKMKGRALFGKSKIWRRLNDQLS